MLSWGVLHHTGAMWEAVGKSASMVAKNGLLALALYRRTRTDTFWKLEKRLCLFSKLPSRSMDFYHDVHDWLGGYPYETAPVFEVEWASDF